MRAKARAHDLAPSEHHGFDHWPMSTSWAQGSDVSLYKKGIAMLEKAYTNAINNMIPVPKRQFQTSLSRTLS
eukprot:gene9975-3123_t